MYPENSLRGISSPGLLTEDGSVSAAVFSFHESRRREDDFIEESINWEDDENATPFTLGQVNSDRSLQFRGGVAVIATSALAQVCALPGVGARLGYERAAVAGNRYHGNLLLAGATPKPAKRMIAAALALAVARVVRQPDVPQRP